jgi:heat-inducible transcriptional repressor
MINELNERTRQILRMVIESYVETGAPVGSKLISEKLGMKLSPATIRSAMGELEALGLLYSPHTSAGRLPTDSGLTVFVEGLMEVADLAEGDRRKIEREIEEVKGQPLPDILEQTSSFLSGLSSCAGLVVAPKGESPVKKVEFVLLAPGRALAVLVTTSGNVENRVMEVPPGITATELQRAANYINTQIADKTLQEAARHIREEMQRQRTQLDALTQKVVAAGIASIGSPESGGHFFIRGQANLLEDVTAIEDLDRIRTLFEALEAKETMLKLLEATAQGDGVKIFIGAENALFSHSGCTLVISPYKNQDAKIIGAIGVIGPTRLNYGRIIPVVNYTSQMIGKIIG